MNHIRKVKIGKLPYTEGNEASGRGYRQVTTVTLPPFNVPYSVGKAAIENSLPSLVNKL